jgi:CheY-like chemotaxis protein
MAIAIRWMTGSMPNTRHQFQNARTAEPSAATRARVLVVDPDEDTRGLYREWFEQSGSVVIEAADGREALAEALARPPALVVCDTRLPFIDGYALCEILRRDYATTRVPILMVTSEGRAAELARATIAGATAILVKPAMSEQIMAEAQRLLETSAERPTDDLSTAEAPPAPRRRTMSKSLPRMLTTTPPLQPPAVICPACDGPLTYRHSHIGGVSNRQPEQWDWFMCSRSCGAFEYRHRTRTLRQLDDNELG